MTHILRIDASARRDGSITRDLADKIITHLQPETVTVRDLDAATPLLDEAWLGANWTPGADRTPEQSTKLGLSDTLIAEVKAADTLVIGAPTYNFAPPAVLKAWIDLICRAGETFRYTDTGPKGLLDGKRAIIVMASGGMQAGSDIDFNTPYLRHIMGFIGITDVTFITADRLMADADEAMGNAQAQIAALAA